jgi:hypothetical protein
MEFEDSSLPPLKVGTTVVVTKELLESANPASEGYIAADMKRAVTAVLDGSFIDPTNAGTVGVEPAAITNGATSVAGTDDAETDLRNLIASFGGDLATSYLVMQPFAAIALHSDVDSEVGARGGFWRGIPVITSSSVPSGTIALLDAAGIGVGFDTVEITAATHASLEMDDNPSSSVVTPTAANLVSLWAANSTALRIEQIANWQRMRDGSVAYISGATWAIGVGVT